MGNAVDVRRRCVDEIKAKNRYKLIDDTFVLFDSVFGVDCQVVVAIESIGITGLAGKLNYESDKGRFILEAPLNPLLMNYKQVFDVVITFRNGDSLLAEGCFVLTSKYINSDLLLMVILLNRITSINEYQKVNFRLIMELPDEVHLTYEDLFLSENMIIQYGNNCSQNWQKCVEITETDKKIQIFTWKGSSRKSNYLVIDTLFPSCSLDIRKWYMNFLLSLGFFNCSYFNDFPHIVVSCSNYDFMKLNMVYAHPGRKNTYCMGLPFFLRNANSLMLSVEETKKWNSLLMPCSADFISQLFNQITGNEYCEQIIRLCLHECNIISELRIIKLLVLLEMSVKWLKDTQGTRKHTLFNGTKEEREEIVQTLGSIIDDPQFSNHFSDEARGIIKKRLDSSLFQPANKDELVNVFIDNGIGLSTYEEKCIEARNQFLHGYLSLPKLVEGQDDFTNLEVMNNTITSLLYRLISKRIEYLRPFLNVNRFQFPYCSEFVDEKMFIIS